MRIIEKPSIIIIIIIIIILFHAQLSFQIIKLCLNLSSPANASTSGVALHKVLENTHVGYFFLTREQVAQKCLLLKWFLTRKKNPD